MRRFLKREKKKIVKIDLESGEAVVQCWKCGDSIAGVDFLHVHRAKQVEAAKPSVRPRNNERKRVVRCLRCKESTHLILRQVMLVETLEKKEVNGNVAHGF